jgi:hypothetical protein
VRRYRRYTHGRRRRSAVDVATTNSALQLKVTLAAVEPPIWCRFVISGSASLAQLHQVLQVVTGWEEYHLHRFEIDGVRCGTSDDEDADEDEIDESTVTVSEALAGPGRCVHEYEFGHGWVHDLVVEKVADRIAGLAVCTGGGRSGPPEDCGGPRGYAGLLDALAKPEHEQHDEYAEWVGEDFDPEGFDLQAVNARLARLR